MSAMEHDPKQLLLEIAGCEVAKGCFADPVSTYPCAKIVSSQGAADWAHFQVPEPWSGKLVTAPLLFLSSNPSISKTAGYPTGSCDEPHLLNFFNDRFDGYWVKDGTMARSFDGTYGPRVHYWVCIQNRATELLGRPARPGVDYALSEIVHCKSDMALGVQSALQTCASKCLLKLLACSAASVLVLVGKKSFNYWNSVQAENKLPPVPPTGGTDLVEIAGRKRFAVYLAAPAGPEPKLFSFWLSKNKADEIRSLIEQNNP